jgi:hypothetical protein
MKKLESLNSLKFNSISKNEMSNVFGGDKVYVGGCATGPGATGECQCDKYSADSKHTYTENGVITYDYTYHRTSAVYANDPSPYKDSCQ